MATHARQLAQTLAGTVPGDWYPFEPRTSPYELTDWLCELGRFGMKTPDPSIKADGRGIFIHRGRDKIVDPEVVAKLDEVRKAKGVTVRPVSDEEIVERLFYPLINEGFKILEEGFVARSSDIDLAYIYGYGFPPSKGGPMFFAENYVGFQKILERLKVYDAQAKERYTKNSAYLPIDYFVPSKLLEVDEPWESDGGRLRRKRTAARALWGKVKAGRVTPSIGLLKWIYQVLDQHHSRNPALLKRVSIALNKNIMANWPNTPAPGNTPWYCRLCKCMRKASANNCDKCGKPWRAVYDPDFVYNPGTASSSNRKVYDWATEDAYWEDAQWVRSPRAAARSPRHGNKGRPHSRRKQGVPHGSGKDPQHGKGGKKGISEVNMGIPHPEPDPPWLQQSLVPPAPLPPLPPPSTPRLDPSLQEFLSECQKNPEDLPPNVQTAYHKIKVVAAKQEGEVLLSAVTSMTDAKQELADAQKQRSVLHGNWTKFLQASVAKWQEYATQFQAAEASAVTRIRNAQNSYTTACTVLNQSKVDAGVSQPTADTLDADDPGMKDVSMVNSDKITASMKHLQDTLSTLQQSADELAEEASHASKRPRTDNSSGTPAEPGLSEQQQHSAQQFGQAALQPFGRPGQQ
eukprot:s605_g10.t1